MSFEKNGGDTSSVEEKIRDLRHRARLARQASSVDDANDLEIAAAELEKKRNGAEQNQFNQTDNQADAFWKELGGKRKHIANAKKIIKDRGGDDPAFL